jgi:hypothetical protein
VKGEDVKLVRDSYFNLLAVFFEQGHIRGSHMRYILKWGAQLNICAQDIDVIGKGLHASYVPPPSEINRLESVYHLVHMIYLDQMAEDSELEVASIYASPIGFP